MDGRWQFKISGLKVFSVHSNVFHMCAANKSQNACVLFWIEVVQPRYRLLLGWVLLCLVSIALSSFVIARRELAEINHVIEQDRSDVQIAAQTFQRSVDAASVLHELIEERLVSGHMHDSDDASAHYMSNLTTNEIDGIVQVGAIGSDGWLGWSSVLGWQPINLFQRSHFRIHSLDGSRRLEISSPLIGLASGRWSVQITRALEDRPGDFAGVAVVSVDPTLLSTQLLMQLPGEGEDVSIRKLQDGTVIAKSRNAVKAFRNNASPEPSLLAAAQLHSEGSLEFDAFGQHMISYYKTMDQLGLFITVSRQKDIELAWLHQEDTIGWMTLAVCLLAFLMIGEMAFRLHSFGERLQYQANRDPLTGLFNRRYLDAAIEHTFNDARTAKKPFSIILADLDHFKRLNDTAGHAAGDQMLRETAFCVLRAVRSSDIVCRYGGEEILILLPDCAFSTAVQCAELMRGRIELLCEASVTATCPITASFGVACFPEHGATPTEVIREADLALYQAKLRGRNQVQEAQTIVMV